MLQKGHCVVKGTFHYERDILAQSFWLEIEKEKKTFLKIQPQHLIYI